MADALPDYDLPPWLKHDLSPEEREAEFIQQVIEQIDDIKNILEGFKAEVMPVAESCLRDLGTQYKWEDWWIRATEFMNKIRVLCSQVEEAFSWCEPTIEFLQDERDRTIERGWEKR